MHSETLPHLWYQRKPLPLLIVHALTGYNRKTLDKSLRALLLEHDRAHTPKRDRWMLTAWGRGVNASCLGRIIRTGTDVEPTDSPIWVELGLGKALEYASEDDQVIMLYEGRRLESTFCEVPADTDPLVLAEHRKKFRTELVSSDGKMIWFTRLPQGDRRATTSYEVEYARWIPGDPLAALLGLVVISQNPLEQTEMFVRKTYEDLPN